MLLLALLLSSTAAVPMPGRDAARGLRLSEVRFVDAAGAPQAVEVEAVGKGLELDGFTLVTGSGEARPLSGKIEPRGMLVVEMKLPVPEGWVGLRDPSGRWTDVIAWGSGHPQAARWSDGGSPGPFEDLPKGMSIGRTSDGRDGLSWSPFDPDETSLGKPNPAPRPKLLFPISGALLPPGAVKLSWFPPSEKPEHARVQVAADESFAKISVDVVVKRREVDLPNLAEGTWFWRVQPVDAEGRTLGAFSEPSQIDVGDIGSITDEWPAPR